MFAYVIKKKMETIIMMVESEIPISVTTNNYSIVESLGWDCIGNDYFSFMFEFFENPDLFCDLSVELNNNLLFANAEQAKKFLSFRENLLATGENLESAFEPIPARLSVVVFNEMANGLPPSPAGKRYRIAATSLNVYRGGPNHRQRRERRVRQPGL